MVAKLHLLTIPGKILFNDMKRSDLFKHAYSMAYVTLLSLIPSLAAIFALASLFQPFLGEESYLMHEARGLILTHLASGSGEQAITYLEKFLANLDLKKIGLTGFAGMIVTLVLLLKQIEVALNRIFLVRRPRNMITRFINFWTFLTFGSFAGSLSIGIVSDFDIKNLFGFGTEVHETSFFASIFPIFSLFILFTILYKIVPNCLVKIKHAAKGAIVATILLYSAAKGYGVYTTSFTSYKAIYGALAAIPIFLIWLYIIWLITLLGAVITWRTQQGFNIEEEIKGKSLSLSTREKLRNYQLQSIIPLFILVTIHKQFKKGKGKALTGNNLSYKLNIPITWVQEAIDSLIYFGFIVPAENLDNPDSSDLMSKRFLPSTPASSISVNQFLEILYKDTNDWIYSWNIDEATEVVSLAKLLHERQAKLNKDLN